MKKKLLNLVKKGMYVSIIGIILQFTMMNTLMAFIDAQEIKSVKEYFIDIEFKNVNTIQALKLIEAKTNYRFAFEKKYIDPDIKITYTAKNKPLSEVLTEISKVTNLKFRQINNDIDVKQIKNAEKNKVDRVEVNLQTRNITGKVTAKDDGQPFPGVNVIERGTTNGTVTSVDGVYSLNVSEGAILVFSSVGFITEEIAIGNRSVIDLVMTEDVHQLEELIVVGYGEQKKVNLTGAIDVVTGDDLSSRPAAQVGQLLQGQAPSMLITMNMRGNEPGVGQKIQIRGVGSILGDSPPLVLVDGVEMDMNLVDPSSIESISVLKDAAASAVYGSRAAFGVILIQTKKGQNRPMRISYGNITSANRPIYVPDMVDSYTYATVFNQARANAGLSPTFGTEQMERIKGYMEGTYPNQYNPAQPPNSIWQGRWMGNDNIDWAQEYYRDYSLQQKHNLNLEGGNENTQYYATLGFQDQPGVIKWGNDRYQRYNFLANISARATDWAKFDFSARAVRTETDRPNGGVWNDRSGYWMHFNIMFPTMPKYNLDGTLHNPIMVALLDGGRILDKDNNAMFSAGTELEPIKGWTTNIRFNYTNRSGTKTNLMYPVDVNISDGLIGNIGFPQSGLIEQLRTGQYIVFTGYTRYEKNIGGHYFSGMAGYEQDYDYNRWITGEGYNLVSLEVPSISTALGTKTVDDAIYHWANQGFFGRINYNFNEKYLLELNARYDGSSRFEKGQRWGFFPSASVGYNISSEDFWAPIEPYVQNLKLRASYGELGNQKSVMTDRIHRAGQAFWEVSDPNSATYLYLAEVPIQPQLGRILDGTRPPYADIPGIKPTRVTWEAIRTTNIGVEAGFLKSRLSMEFDWYYRITDNMLGPSVQLPSVLGANAPWTNNAKLETKGFELTLGWRDQVGDFSYNGKFTLGDYQTKILEYINETGNVHTWYPGKKHGDLWGLTTDGLIQEDGEEMPDQTYYYSTWGPGDIKYIDLNGDGKIDPGTQTLDNHGDLTVIVNTTPRYQIGFSAGFNWKSLDFNMFWQGIGSRPFIPNSGSEFYWGHLNNPNSALLLENSRHLDYWRPANETNILGPNTDAFQPKPYFSSQRNKNFQTQTRFIDNARYLRLKNLQIGFTLPRNIVESTFINNLRVYFSGENLLTLQSLDRVFEPENMIASDTYMRTYPITQMYSLGLNVTF